MSTRSHRLASALGGVLVTLLLGGAGGIAGVMLMIGVGAQGIAVPNTFANRTAADADQVNANFAALANGALNRAGGTMTGTLTSRHIIPSTDDTYDLGDSSHKFNDVYVNTLHADSVSGLDSVPSGVVVFYNGGSCPSGWTEYTAARGRYLVGLPSGGTLNGTAGSALTNTENRTHTHTVTVDAGGAHTHAISVPSTNGGGSSATAFDVWLTGFENPDSDGNNSEIAYHSGSIATASDGSHTHTASTGSASGLAPYLQLLVCQKS